MWVPCKKNVYQKGEAIGPSDKKGCVTVKIEGGDVSDYVMMHYVDVYVLLHVSIGETKGVASEKFRGTGLDINNEGPFAFDF